MNYNHLVEVIERDYLNSRYSDVDFALRDAGYAQHLISGGTMHAVDYYELRLKLQETVNTIYKEYISQ